MKGVWFIWPDFELNPDMFEGICGVYTIKENGLVQQNVVDCFEKMGILTYTIDYALTASVMLVGERGIARFELTDNGKLLDTGKW